MFAITDQSLAGIKAWAKAHPVPTTSSDEPEQDVSPALQALRDSYMEELDKSTSEAQRIY